jgi:tRNA/tmRNA/rRNA uracil-C5-methylase (TrmA/RlmC/RlmD family)
VGFYREGTHELCDAASTGQLTDAAVASAAAMIDSLAAAGAAAVELELAENVAADQRVIHVEASPEARVTEEMLDLAIRAGGLTGCTIRDAGGTLRTAGIPVVSDPLPVITAGRAGGGALQRHAESFFQANRFLLPALVGTVLDAVLSEGDVLDLYAGVGLFSVSLAASGREGIVAVEGDRSAAADLQRNAAACGSAIRVVTDSVERYLSRAPRRRPRTVVVDPPRTGISKEAIAGVLRRRAQRIAYVSCDPATMARDARRLVDAGYRLSSLQAFDLFPGTPHVEALGVFDAE